MVLLTISAAQPQSLPTDPDSVNPTQVRYLDFWGPIEAFWNFDQLPAGTWFVEVSKDLVHWSTVPDAPISILNGPACVTWNLPPEMG